MLVSTAGFVACGSDSPDTPESVPGDAVAVVGEVPIPRSVFERRFNSQARGMAGFFDNSRSGVVLDAPRFPSCISRLRKDILRSMQTAGAGSSTRPSTAQLRENCELQYNQLKQRTVSDLVTEQWHIQAAADFQVDLTEKAVSARLDEYADRLTAGKARSQARFKKKMKRAGLRRSDVLSELRAQLARQAWEAANQGEAKLDEDEARKYYDDNPGRFGNAATRTVEIVATDEEKSAESAASQLEKGEAVAAVSAELSSDFSIRGGDGVLRVEQGGSILPETVESGIFTAGKGEVKGPVEADGKWYLYRVVGSTEADVPPYEKVRDLARDMATAVAVQRNMVEATNSFRNGWRSRTLCASDHLVPECSNGPQMPPLPLP